MHFRSGVILAGLVFAVLLAVPPANNAASTATAASPTANPAASDYVGADTCKTCHEDMFKNFERTPHWKTMLDTHGGPSHQGCEACHGPGKAHVDSGGDPTKIFGFKGKPASEVTARCLTCHEYTEEHGNFARSLHNVNNVSCIDCHSPHHAKVTDTLLKVNQPQLCYGCHLEQRADFAKPFHHRVNEGLILCSDCHNEHGGYQRHQLRSTAFQDAVCVKCHTEKAGPFAFEHQPVKTEGCTTCHTPHGSSNPRLLTRATVTLLCLQCHTPTTGMAVPGTPTFHNLAQPRYQSCTMCHTQIHGSNFDEFFFR